jgi:hypothetical protein
MPTASPLRATWVPLSYLAHEERMDPRTLKKQLAGQPFVQRLGPRAAREHGRFCHVARTAPPAMNVLTPAHDSVLALLDWSPEDSRCGCRPRGGWQTGQAKGW